jgi:hypothetical protein
VPISPSGILRICFNYPYKQLGLLEIFVEAFATVERRTFWKEAYIIPKRKEKYFYSMIYFGTK